MVPAAGGSTGAAACGLRVGAVTGLGAFGCSGWVGAGRATAAGLVVPTGADSANERLDSSIKMARLNRDVCCRHELTCSAASAPGEMVQERRFSGLGIPTRPAGKFIRNWTPSVGA